MKIIDNINQLLGDDLKETITPSSKLRIAASCFSIYAFEYLRKELSQIESLQFIFTSPTFLPEEVLNSSKKEKREFFIPKQNREKSLYGSEFEIQLRNKLNQKAISKECAAWMQKKTKFSSNVTNAPMQQFACVSSETKDYAYMPLHGFTAVDLGYQKGNAISNMVNRLEENQHTASYLHLFDQIWSDKEKLKDVTEIIHDHISTVYQENSPEKVYFQILYNIFSEFLDDLDQDVLPNDHTGYLDTQVWKKLYNFQKDAAVGIINKLETHNGCILADSVGLGKTFTALAVIKYYELRNRSVLVLCPKKLADNWLNYNRNLTTNIFSKDRLNYDVLCHTDLSREAGDSFGMALNRVNWGNFDLVVIDESHNFRNNDAVKERETRYQKLMNQVIRQGVKTKVLMLSATPVNNRFNDLRNQLALAYEGQSENLSKNLRTGKSVEEIFRNAQTVFNNWSKLNPEERTPKAILESLDFDFFELLDNVTIARSRKHIETFYDTSEIGKFPERRKPLAFRCPLTCREDVMDFNEIFKQLSLLKLCVYAPISYVLPSRLRKYEEMYDTSVEGGRAKLRQVDRERSLQALMTTNLLKRLESSVHAFRLTLSLLGENNKDTIAKIENFKKSGLRTDISNWTAGMDDLDPESEDVYQSSAKIGDKIQISLEDMDLESWGRDLENDLSIINKLLNSMNKVSPEEDSKLQHLKTHLLHKIDHPINPDNRKILIFTAFSDTADYLYKNLAPEIFGGRNLHVGKITGSDSPKSTLPKKYDVQSILTLFSPRSKEKALIFPDEENEIEILIGTDCISEGQNLQDCDYLVNYDIHWNPVRIIQRFGRIDRIGSINDTIQLVNYWPDISLDEYINLKERVENRMIIADVTATGDDNVLTSKSSDVSYRKEQLRRLQDEVIDLEDVKTGVSITDLGLNDFRMDLLNYMKSNESIANIPNGMHAVVPADSSKGLQPGVIFALKNINQSVNLNQKNRLHPYYLVYISKDGQLITSHTEPKPILDLLRTSCRGHQAPFKTACDLFNQKTEEGKDMQEYSSLLSSAIKSMIDIKEENDLDSLFSGGNTSALVDVIAGLDDFELIAFLVVQNIV